MSILGTALSTAIVGGDIAMRTTNAATDQRVGSGYRRVNATKAAASGAVDWGIYLVAIRAMDYLLSRTIDKFEPTRRFRDNHPVATYIGSLIGVVYGSSYIASKGRNAFMKLIQSDRLDQFLYHNLNKPGPSKFIEKIRPSVYKFARFLQKPMVMPGITIGLAALVLGMVSYVSGQLALAKKGRDTLNSLNYSDDVYLNTSSNSVKRLNDRRNSYYNSRSISDRDTVGSNPYDLPENLHVNPGDRILVLKG